MLRIQENMHATRVLHRCHGQISLSRGTKVLCGNLFNRYVGPESHKFIDSGICSECGYRRSEPVQGYLPETRDLLIANGTHPELWINVNGQVKVSKTGKVQKGTQWLECQEISQDEVFNLHLGLRRTHEVIEVRNMGVQS